MTHPYPAFGNPTKIFFCTAMESFWEITLSYQQAHSWPTTYSLNPCSWHPQSVTWSPMNLWSLQCNLTACLHSNTSCIVYSKGHLNEHNGVNPLLFMGNYEHCMPYTQTIPLGWVFSKRKLNIQKSLFHQKAELFGFDLVYWFLFYAYRGICGW